MNNNNSERCQAKILYLYVESLEYVHVLQNIVGPFGASMKKTRCPTAVVLAGERDSVHTKRGAMAHASIPRLTYGNSLPLFGQLWFSGAHCCLHKLRRRDS